MNEKKTMKQTLVTTLAVVGMSLGGLAAAQDDTTKDLTSVTCRDVLLATGDERDGIILVLHAYLLGEKKQTGYDTDALGAATDRFLDACIDAPDAEALGTMREQVAAD